MKQHITGNTIANTVRMGRRSRRPKAVFLASDQTDVELVQALLSANECRVIPAHSRENAVRAFEILVKSGWEGVVTAVNSRFAPITEQEILGQGPGESKEAVSLEGSWEEVVSQGAVLMGQRVRVTVVDESGQSGEIIGRPNTAMLQALTTLEALRVNMNPRPDRGDYLREAREGAMYGFSEE